MNWPLRCRSEGGFTGLDVPEPDVAEGHLAHDVGLVPVDVAMIGVLTDDAAHRVEQVGYGDQAAALVEDRPVDQRAPYFHTRRKRSSCGERHSSTAIVTTRTRRTSRYQRRVSA